MKKFTIHVRRNEHTIYEVECEKLQPIDDPSVMWLKEDEYKARVTAPEALLEKKVEGDKTTFTQPVWCSHAFYDTVLEAETRCAKDIRHEMVEFAMQKRRAAASEEEIRAEVAKIKVVML